MVWFTGDAVRDAECHADEQERWLQSRPVCSCCEEHIQEDSYYEIGGLNICENCLDSFKRYTD